MQYIIEKMREFKDDPFIACDVIAGLPGESEKDFMMTYDFLERNKFAAMHVFPYSPRKGTPLYGAKDRVEERVRDERASVLRSLSKRLSSEYVGRQLGKTVEILAEKGNSGTTGNYLKAGIALPAGRAAVEGMLYEGVITSVDPVSVSVRP